MARFDHTPEGLAFIASARSRETSTEIMEAIAFFATSLAEAEQVWSGDLSGICSPMDLWERVTRNGHYDDIEFYWGVNGRDWFGLIATNRF